MHAASVWHWSSRSSCNIGNSAQLRNGSPARVSTRLPFPSGVGRAAQRIPAEPPSTAGAVFEIRAAGAGASPGCRWLTIGPPSPGWCAWRSCRPRLVLAGVWKVGAGGTAVAGALTRRHRCRPPRPCVAVRAPALPGLRPPSPLRIAARPGLLCRLESLVSA